MAAYDRSLATSLSVVVNRREKCSDGDDLLADALPLSAPAIIECFAWLTEVSDAVGKGLRANADFSIREEIGAAQVEQLRQRRLDLGIMHVAAGAPPEGLRVLQLRAEPLSIALPADHRLAQRAVLNLSELRDEPLVLVRPEQEADTSALYLGACADAGFAARAGPQVTRSRRSWASWPPGWAGRSSRAR